MKVGIVGSGMVGATAAYAMVMHGVGREVVLVDKSRERAEAEADDLRHAVPFAHPMEVRAGDYADLAGCHAVVIGAGANQKPGETRMQLLLKNAAVFREVVPQIVGSSPEAVLIVATNPVDVMTHLACRICSRFGVAPGRVLGSGTTLDTARFRTLLASLCGVDPHHVHAQVIGEHGDSEVLTWSGVTVAGMPLGTFAESRQLDLSDPVRETIDQSVRRAAYSIIQGKGATYYGIGSALSRVVRAVIHDERSVLTVCMPTESVEGVSDVTLSLPRIVGGPGVLDTFFPPLDQTERTQFRSSAMILRQAIEQLGPD